jgi:AbrB family looped-hinge helix DNA binding protein
MEADLITKIGKKGVIVIPAKLRELFGFKEGTLVIAEAREDGILIKPVVTLPVEIYSTSRIAEFLLNNSVDAEEYEEAVSEVKLMGLNPEEILHEKPKMLEEKSGG